MASKRWGSLLQQAVAGVESRLDNILGEVEEGPREQDSTVSKSTSQETPPAPTKKPDGLVRTVSASSSTNYRLQERLARALSAKKAANAVQVEKALPGDIETQSTCPIASSEIAQTAAQDGNSKISRTHEGVKSSMVSTSSQKPQGGQPLATSPSGPHVIAPVNSIDENTAKDLLMESSSIHVSSSGVRAFQHPIANEVFSSDSASNPPIDEAPMLDADTDASHHPTEELNIYIERIDSLQAKLQFLARQAAESARATAAEAGVGSVEKKLAEKDQQIALLMEEGQGLAKTEFKHLTMIKKLRASSAKAAREHAGFKKRLETMEKQKTLYAESLKRVDSLERQLNDRQKATFQAQKELALMTADNNAKDLAIAQLKTQLGAAISQAKADEVRAVQNLLDLEKKRVLNLENDLSTAKIENELASGRARVKFEELKAKFERESERARARELEMKAEQQMLEGRLELLQTRAEEVSSGAAGDAQTKYLRQIETLQSQHAIARENWQRIELSLTSRTTQSEREKEEALKREAEVRRKARELKTKSKRHEEDLEALRSKATSVEREISKYQEAAAELKTRAEGAEARLREAISNFDEERKSWTLNMSNPISSDKHKQQEELMSSGHGSYNDADMETPSSSRRGNLTAELLGLQNLQTRRHTSRQTDNAPMDRLVTRHSSKQPSRPASGRHTPGTPVRSQSFIASPSEERMDSQCITRPDRLADQEDYFESAGTFTSSHEKPNDLISVSTIGAGPSVQLVERMSAAVRRLEAEKVSTKDSLSRLSAQRDEARAEIVSLMQEIESKRSLDMRLKELEEENVQINARYQTTLEMLGEKTEMVEELRADVQDVKEMYRELVERTVK